MRVFRDLFVYINRERTDLFIKKIEDMLEDGWIHDTEAEKRSEGLGEYEFIYFVCTEKGERNSALLAFARKDETVIYVSNIVPKDKHELSHDEYNNILEEFFNRFVSPVSKELKIKVELTENEKNLEDWISEGSIKKLRLFSVAANKSTGSAHPLDQKRWLDFLISVHHEHHNLHSSQLQRWLIEVENWPEDIAVDLAVEYEFAMNLLDFKEGV